jgi:hypothetical protein
VKGIAGLPDFDHQIHMAGPSLLPINVMFNTAMAEQILDSPACRDLELEGVGGKVLFAGRDEVVCGCYRRQLPFGWAMFILASLLSTSFSSEAPLLKPRLTLLSARRVVTSQS